MWIPDQIGQSDDTRIGSLQSIISPETLIHELPLEGSISERIIAHRQAVSDIIHWKDSRILVVTWPCSIHDPKSAKEYAEKVAEWRKIYWDQLEVVMRTYWEKPRTTVWWKWLINDPHMNGTNSIEDWLRAARWLLIDINELWVPTATELLDVITPQYIWDLISWWAIWARTTESQVHRELASWLSCPVWFKNGTDGNVQVAVDSLVATWNPHTFLSVGKNGQVAIVETRGNQDTHIILRWGNTGVNYNSESVLAASALAKKVWVNHRIMVDLSHANALNDDRKKDYRWQKTALNSVIQQVRWWSSDIMAIMIESHLHEWKQDLKPWKTDVGTLKYGVSITDWCISADETENMLDELARAQIVRQSRK